MPMPHQTQMQLIKRRLTGKEGSERVRELRAILTELPGYKNGPYADLRTWVMDQIDETRTRSSPDLLVVGVTVLDDDSLGGLKQEIWRLTGLIRVFLRHDGVTDREPLAMQPDATIADVAEEIHKEIGHSFRGARVWGESARFEGQRVGREHRVMDGDVVEIIA